MEERKIKRRRIIRRAASRMMHGFASDFPSVRDALLRLPGSRSNQLKHGAFSSLIRGYSAFRPRLRTVMQPSFKVPGGESICWTMVQHELRGDCD